MWMHLVQAVNLMYHLNQIFALISHKTISEQKGRWHFGPQVKKKRQLSSSGHQVIASLKISLCFVCLCSAAMQPCTIQAAAFSWSKFNLRYNPWHAYSNAFACNAMRMLMTLTTLSHFPMIMTKVVPNHVNIRTAHVVTQNLLTLDAAWTLFSIKPEYNVPWYHDCICSPSKHPFNNLFWIRNSVGIRRQWSAPNCTIMMRIPSCQVSLSHMTFCLQELCCKSFTLRWAPLQVSPCQSVGCVTFVSPGPGLSRTPHPQQWCWSLQC